MPGIVTFLFTDLEGPTISRDPSACTR